jgi:hypothetical protein
MNRGFVSLHPYFKAHPGKMDAIKAMRGKTTEYGRVLDEK